MDFGLALVEKIDRAGAVQAARIDTCQYRSARPSIWQYFPAVRITVLNPQSTDVFLESRSSSVKRVVFAPISNSSRFPPAR